MSKKTLIPYALAAIFFGTTVHYYKLKAAFGEACIAAGQTGQRLLEPCKALYGSEAWPLMQALVEHQEGSDPNAPIWRANIPPEADAGLSLNAGSLRSFIGRESSPQAQPGAVGDEDDNVMPSPRQEDPLDAPPPLPAGGAREAEAHPTLNGMDGGYDTVSALIASTEREAPSSIPACVWGARKGDAAFVANGACAGRGNCEKKQENGKPCWSVNHGSVASVK